MKDHPRRPGSRQLGVLAAVAAITLTVGCGPTSHQGGNTARPPASSTPPSPTASASPTPKPIPRTPIHASLFQGDGMTYGVGMPIIMRFDRAVPDPTDIEAAIRVTSTPPSSPGAWYWFTKTEAHYRPPTYWPAHATITLDAPLKGVPAGPRRAVDNNLTLTMHTGAAHVSTINATSLKMTVTSDNVPVRTIPVSLGKPGHRTFYGVKVVESKSNPERMISDPPHGPGSYNVLVPWSVRVTNSGEFIHAAPWNPLVGQSDQSHGCTNLNSADARWFYNFSGVGDVVTTTHGPGMPLMRAWDGWGDWNVPWATWTAGKHLPPPDPGPQRPEF
jgi:lipoprotein-anchoring transpeptidase ErfK/SrfK